MGEPGQFSGGAPIITISKMIRDIGKSAGRGYLEPEGILVSTMALTI
jgi:hypothetical protein